MSGFGWQEAAVAVIVLAAAGWLVRRARRAHRERVACANCPIPKLPPPSLRASKRAPRTHAKGSARTQ
jgi:hypothetical protein